MRNRPGLKLLDTAAFAAAALAAAAAEAAAAAVAPPAQEAAKGGTFRVREPQKESEAEGTVDLGLPRNLFDIYDFGEIIGEVGANAG